MTLTLRDARPEDAGAIRDLTAEAFAPMRFSDGTEATLPAALRADGDMVLERVGILDGRIVAHVAFSPARVGGEVGWCALGPISIAPAVQRRGYGSALIRDALELLRAQGARGCVLTGNPAVYGPLGFANDGRVAAGDTPARNVMWLGFDGAVPSGEIAFAPAFGD